MTYETFPTMSQTDTAEYLDAVWSGLERAAEDLWHALGLCGCCEPSDDDAATARAEFDALSDDMELATADVYRLSVVGSSVVITAR